LIYKEVAVEGTEAIAKGTTAGYYLIIARYKWEKWKALAYAGTEAESNNSASVASTRTLNESKEKPSRHKKAKEIAERLFPYKEDDLTLSHTEETAEPEVQPLPYPHGVLFLHTFHSNIHTKVAQRTANMSTTEWSQKGKAILEDIFEEFEGSGINAPGTTVKDQGVGWVALVHPASLEDLVQKMSGDGISFWDIYDIKIIPLNNDQTTDDIYKYMTPSNWKT
jgi:hypothetical protein